MVYYQEARKIYYNLEVGQQAVFNEEDFPKVQQSLNVVKRRHKDKDKKFKSNKKTLSIERITIPVKVLSVVS